MRERETVSIYDGEVYAEARKRWQEIHQQQICKGNQKYGTPLNPEDWTTEELILHAMQENVDQFHYLTALLLKVRGQT